MRRPFTIVQFDDDRNILFESDPVEPLEYARFSFFDDLQVPSVWDDENIEWLVINPDNWLEAFPYEKRVLATWPDSNYELDYSTATSFGFSVTFQEGYPTDIIVLGETEAKAKASAEAWAQENVFTKKHHFTDVAKADINAQLLYEYLGESDDSYGEGMAIAAITIARAMYPLDADLEERKPPPDYLKPSRF